ncbi:MAG TPA: fibronectin type III domain-containing protein [Candidatus Competibacter sp.]|nr:hypothetical protein [Candidatus Competibacteraceae bacterium]HRC72865.1 fibronectin type III domain-containing protein [Candidatus Competibacter sp.]
MPTLFSKRDLPDFTALKPLKPRFSLAALWLICSAPALATPITLGWDASSGSVAGYHVHYGPISARYTSTATVAASATSYTTPDLAAGTYYFAVSAFDGAGNESSYSNEVSTTVAAAAPKPTGGGTTTPGASALPTQLINLSTRAWVGAGDSVLIAGFVIRGTSPKKVLIRAIGPSMAKAGVPNLLYDPTLTLYSGQTVLASNNDWQDSQKTAIEATGKAPPDPQESAILTTLNPGPYTAIIRGVNDTTGNALVEVYDIERSTIRLINVSTRGRTETGDSVMIAGFVIGGSSPKQILVRALGPALNAAGVPQTLADPTLTLYQGQTVVTGNDNWQDGQKTAIEATRKAPLNPQESAILKTLNPGAYTAIVRGANGTVGNSLVEVYDLD